MKLTKKQAFELCNFEARTFGGNSWFEYGRIPSKKDYDLLRVGMGLDNSFDILFHEVEREFIKNDRNWGQKGTTPVSGYGDFAITKGISTWEGWGTALKPAMEDWWLLRRPLSEKTVAQNCLKWGVGGINIDGCRVGTELMVGVSAKSAGTVMKTGLKADYKSLDKIGRWPANLIHDGSDEVVECFPNDSQRFFYSPKASKKDRDDGLEGFIAKERVRQGLAGEKDNTFSRNSHPTVKPTSLMRYLVKLVTPSGGTVLDPFTGSGSTGKACKLEGFDFIGIEREPEYLKIAEARIVAVPETLFDC